MKFGYFDDKNREYVITSPKTPYPWINYLGTQGFFSLISNTAGGYCFYKDAKHSGYMERFEELLDGAVHCNNVSVLRSYQDKSDALKIRLLNEMVDEDNRLAQQALAQAEAEQKRLAEEARNRHRAAAEGPAACRQGAQYQEPVHQDGGKGCILEVGKRGGCR